MNYVARQPTFKGKVDEKVRECLTWIWEELQRSINNRIPYSQDYLNADKPGADTVRVGTIIHVTDNAPGSQWQISNGTTWDDLG